MTQPIKHWTTESFLSQSDPSERNALIILNTPLVHDVLFRRIWAAASVKYCADGGANRLYARYGPRRRASRDEDNSGDAGDDAFLPDEIRGDLDSLKPHVRDYYKSKGVPVIHDPDQYSTDLGKCVAALVEAERAEAGRGTAVETPKEHQLVILGGLSGRLDQTVHTLHALMQLERNRTRTWAVGRESVACVLGKGTHRIETTLDHFGDTCGVLPVGQPAKVCTNGLKWDIGPDTDYYPTSVAECVSTSNHLPQKVVTVDTDEAIVWTVEVRVPEEDGEE